MRASVFALTWLNLLKDERTWGGGTRFDEAVSRAAFQRLIRPIPPAARTAW